MGKKWKITAAIAAAAGAVASALWLSKDKNRKKAKDTYEDAKSHAVSATNKAKKSATKSARKAKKQAKKTAKQATKELRITDVKGIGPKRAKALRKAGIVSLPQLRSSSLADLAKKGGVSESTARKWQNSAKGMK